MKKLERKWKRIIGWTFFVHLLILVAIVRYRWAQVQQEPLQDKINKASQNSAPHHSPSEPNKIVEEVSKDELARLLEQAPEGWEGASVEKREKALSDRIDELAVMEPERVEGIVNHLMDLSGKEAVLEKKVEITELDLDSAVPVNMMESLDSEGNPTVIMTLQDSDGRMSELFVDPDDMSPEEVQALRAFKMMNKVPALHKLRPLLTPLMRK
jgi:hypothetical protein